MAKSKSLDGQGLDFSALEETIGELESAVDGADALMDALFAEAEANKNDPVKLQAFVDRGRAAKAKLAASVAKNTPAEEPTDPNEPSNPV